MRRRVEPDTVAARSGSNDTRRGDRSDHVGQWRPGDWTAHVTTATADPDEREIARLHPPRRCQESDCDFRCDRIPDRPGEDERWSTDNLRRTGWPDNDYVIKNDSPKLRIMPVVTTARIRTIDSGRSVQATKPHTLNALAAYLDAQGSAALPYWLTAKNGRITAIREIYLP
jgi:hypothetical protein